AIVKQAAADALEAGHTGYTPSPGIPALRDAIAEKLADDGLDQYDPAGIMVTPGAKQALYEVFQTLIDHGDEVVLLDPAWVSYEAMAKLAGATLARVDTAQYDFRLEDSLGDLAGVVTDETELLVLNSPGNPHGMVYSRPALEGVRDIAARHDVTVVADEIYGEITYNGPPERLGTLEGMRDRTITVNGFSKAFAMTGWRLGYFAGSEELVEQAGKLHGHSVSCATSFVQHAGVTALNQADEAVDEMVDAFQARRDLLVELLADRGIDVPSPQGAFYLMVPVDDDDESWCERAIEDAHVATVPGSAFGTPGYARFSYANSQDRIRDAIDRLAGEGLL
ncbi:MAG: pyridoxal phosphate-dependent aminotransferase, partial [Salinirussus sp.]